MRKSNELKVNGIRLPPVVVDLPGGEIPEYHVSHEEAVRLVKRSRGRTLFVRANQFAPSRNQDGVPHEHMRGRDVFASVEASRKAVLRFLENAYTTRTRQECYVRMAVADNCLFIG